MVDKFVDMNGSKTLSKVKLHIDFIYGINLGCRSREHSVFVQLLLHHGNAPSSGKRHFLMAVLRLTNDLYELQICRRRFCVNFMTFIAADFVQYNIIGAFLLVRRQAKNCVRKSRALLLAFWRGAWPLY